MNQPYETSTRGVYIHKVNRLNFFIHWKEAGTYATETGELPTITAQSVDDWASQLEALIEMIDPMFWPSFRGAEYRQRNPSNQSKPMDKTHEVLRNLHEALLVGHSPQFRIADLDKVLNPIRIAIVSILEVCDDSTREWVTSNYSRTMTRML